MPKLALYDVSGIQSYIFSSNDLKENIGASNIVKDILDKDLPHVIGQHTQRCRLDWEESKEFNMLKDTTLDAEIIYIGGGKAMVAYREDKVEEGVTRAFSRYVFQKSYSLSVISESITTDFSSFFNDQKELLSKHTKKKKETNKSMPLLGISITKQDIKTGLPVTFENEEGAFTTESYLKREKSRNLKESIKSSIFNNEEIDSEYSFIKDNNSFTFTDQFDQLGKKDGDSKIAVVHIDGNNMGKKIKDVIKEDDTYQEAVLKMRRISSKINKAYRVAYKKTVELLEDNMKWLKGKLYIHAIEENGSLKDILPIRKIILDGDDVTFVCHAKLALSLTEKFLKEVNKIKIEEFNEPLSACGGFVIINNHFPFSRAYSIAEACCSNAKRKANLNRYKKDDETVLSWLDFHIVHGGVTTDLGKIRERLYNIPGLADASIKDSSNQYKQYKQYNLLWRPYLINDNAEKGEKLNVVKDLLSILMGEHGIDTNSKPWPRSRLKELREVLMKGKEETYSYLNECETRGYRLPEAGTINSKDVFIDERTPYYDVLELLDFYIELKEGSTNEEDAN